MLSEKNCELFYDLFGHIERALFVEKKKRDKFCELLSEKNDPFGAVLSDFFGRSLFW